MSLPSLTLPRSLPPWLAAGHGVEPEPIYADVPMRTGHARKRRVWRSAPRTVTVGLVLSQVRMTAFFEWFEGPARQGSEPFSTRVPSQGPGLLWWSARFVEQPNYEALGRLHFDDEGFVEGWRVTAKLLLTGSGYTAGPSDGRLAASVRIGLYGSAALTVRKPLAASVRIALEPALRLRASVSIGLVPAAPVTPLRASVRIALEPAIRLRASVSIALLPATRLRASVTIALLPVAPTSADPDFASVVLLLRGDGADGSTTFNDYSAGAHSCVASGGTHVSTANPKFGAGAIQGVAGGKLTCSLGADGVLSGDFTIEAFVSSASNTVVFYTADGKYLYSGNLQNGGNIVPCPSYAADSTYFHLAISRVGTQLRTFKDGVLYGSATYAGTLDLSTVTFGFYAPNNNLHFVGYLDEVRITNGIGRYAADFTPPTAPFPNA